MKNNDRTNWIDEALEQEDGTGDEELGRQSSKNERDVRLTIAICRKECKRCGATTVRSYHEDCEAPIIYIDEKWQCGSCGVKITSNGCLKCGGPVDLKRVETPLDLSLPAQSTEIEHDIHKETNQRRRDNGLATLEYSSHLSAIALQHSRDMAQRGYFDHTAPDGHKAIDRYQKFGHDTRSCGENIIREYPDPTATAEESARVVVDGWMNSSGHRENILNESFEREGIGVYLDPDGGLFVTQNFY